MNKVIIGIGVLAVVALGWFLLNNNTVEYAAVVNGEVAQLEESLALLEAEVNAGTLSPADAAKAQVSIVARIDAVNGAVSAGQKAQLTDAQRAQLVEGLERLKQALIKYSETLQAVDTAVLELPEAERPQLSRRGGGGSNRGGVAAIATEAIEIADEQVEEIIDEITDEEIIDEVTASSTDETSDDTASSSDEMLEDVGSEEEVVEGENGEVEAEDSEAVETEEAVGTEAEVEPTDSTDSEDSTSSEVEIEAEADVEVDSETTSN